MAPRNKKQRTEYEALVKEYNRLAKKADVSLRATESYQHDPNFGIMMKWSYAKAQQDIKRFGGNNRFQTAPPKSTQMLKAKINAIQDYLDSPTRTKTSVRKMFMEKASSINAEYGTNLKWSEVGAFFESEAWHKIESMYGSKTAMRVIGQLKKKGVDIVKEITDAAGKHIKAMDGDISDLVDSSLEANGIKIEDLY